LGLGAPITYTISNAIFEEGLNDIVPTVFNGSASMTGSGASLGGGSAYSTVTLGGATSSPGWGAQGGVDATAYAYPLGNSELENVVWVDCESKCEPGQ